ncbi:inositol monophosphatase 2-like [Pogonomyrmex barbatus]|uniref:Inositol-1-monophosphatase n=1 Tax=Pogonomyrmex barbatus TaxID=144034 RepID=A0A6I9VUT1_9HYME|nr:inositol monophosphatase 2-like [Pogonomyrmex barbatus]
MSSDPDIARYFEIAKELTLQAGQIIKCHCEEEKVVYVKNKNDFVTDFDNKIEKLFFDNLSKEFPNHKIIAEEAAAKMLEMPELTDAPTWFIDPIDGTTNFIHSFPQFCISVGLMICKELVLGIIYNPMHSEFYSAIKGKGAFLNGKPICCSKVTELKEALIGLETSIALVISVGANKDIYTGRINALVEITQGVRNIGSAAMAMAYVARGALDSFHLDDLKPWDVAAGTLIIREAGGIVIDTKGGEYNVMKPKTIAASSETLARELSKFIIDIDLKTQRKRLKRT